MSLLTWIIFGALVGWLGSLIMGTDERQGALANIFVGIAGAILGGLLMSLIGSTGVSGFDIRSILVALLGAVVLLAVVRGISRSRSY